MKKKYLVIFILILISCKEHNSGKKTENASFTDFFNQFNLGKTQIDSTIVIAYNEEILKSFYKKNKYEVAWEEKENRDFVLNEIEQSINEGLDPNDYAVLYLTQLESNYENLSETEKVTYDIELTRSFQKYIKHIYKGKVNPYELYDDWDYGQKNIDVNSVLFECFDSNNFSDIINKQKPQLKLYEQLKSALKNLNSISDKDIEQVDLREKFTPNTSSKTIIDVKRKLILWGDLKKKDSVLSKNYDKVTQSAVKLFQKRHGLRADGVIGKGTIDALNYSRNQRIIQVIANLERLRWLPKDLGNHYLLVNLPNYYLTVFKDNDSVRSHKVVIGKEDRKTPLLSARISNLVFNPNWTVPPTILKEDVFPEAKRSKSAFSRRGLHIFDYKNREVSPWKWKMEDSKKYKYVQNPSRNNSLGFLKINFQNKYAVYLHDTNHRNYFKYEFRSLSSGCVRVENPLELGEYLLNDAENWSLEKIHELTKNSKKLKTTTVDLTEDIYVHFLYNTAWMENEKLQFREDIYCLDFNLYTKLRY